MVDIAEQVKAERGDEAEFIHMEIYRDNKIEKGFRPQVAAWRLPTEPWLFAIDRTGKVAARLEGAYSAGELGAALDRATRLAGRLARCREPAAGPTSTSTRRRTP